MQPHLRNTFNPCSKASIHELNRIWALLMVTGPILYRESYGEAIDNLPFQVVQREAIFAYASQHAPRSPDSISSRLRRTTPATCHYQYSCFCSAASVLPFPLLLITRMPNEGKTSVKVSLLHLLKVLQSGRTTTFSLCRCGCYASISSLLVWAVERRRRHMLYSTLR